MTDLHRLGGASVGHDETSATGPGRDYGEVLWAPTAQSAEAAEVTRYARWLAAHGGPQVSGVAGGGLVLSLIHISEPTRP